MSIATIPVTPTLTRKDGSAIALSDLSGVTGFLSVKGANAFTPIGTLPPAAVVKFVIPDISSGDYDFYAVETDTQVPPVSSDSSAVKSFNVPAPILVLAAPNAPVVGDVVIS